MPRKQPFLIKLSSLILDAFQLPKILPPKVSLLLVFIFVGKTPVSFRNFFSCCCCMCSISLISLYPLYHPSLLTQNISSGVMSGRIDEVIMSNSIMPSHEFFSPKLGDFLEGRLFYFYFFLFFNNLLLGKIFYVVLTFIENNLYFF